MSGKEVMLTTKNEVPKIPREIRATVLQRMDPAFLMKAKEKLELPGVLDFICEQVALGFFITEVAADLYVPHTVMNRWLSDSEHPERWERYQQAKEYSADAHAATATRIGIEAQTQEITEDTDLKVLEHKRKVSKMNMDQHMKLAALRASDYNPRAVHTPSQSKESTEPAFNLTLIVGDEKQVVSNSPVIDVEPDQDQPDPLGRLPEK